MSFRFDVDEVTQCPLISKVAILRILKQEYGIENAKVSDLTGYEDSNMRLEEIVWEERRRGEAREAILKITNPIEAREKAHLELQHHVCSLLNSSGIPTLSLIPRKDGQKWALVKVAEGVCLPVRMFHVLPGTTLEHFPFTAKLVTSLGRIMGKIHLKMDSLRGLRDSHTHIPFISLENVDSLEREVGILIGKRLLSEERAQTVREVFVRLRGEILHSDPVDFGLIHSDLNETNVLIEQRDGELEITGVLDFGDMHFSHRIFDFAAAVLYLHLSDKEDQGFSTLLNNFLIGYEEIRPFNERKRILTALRARLACSLVYGLRTARINCRGGSTDYILKTQSNGWETLQKLAESEEI